MENIIEIDDGDCGFNDYQGFLDFSGATVAPLADDPATLFAQEFA